MKAYFSAFPAATGKKNNIMVTGAIRKKSTMRAAYWERKSEATTPISLLPLLKIYLIGGLLL